MKSSETFRFAGFELDVAAYELRHHGSPVRLERRPMELLVLLVEQRGRLVLRSEIVDRLWGKGTFLDADQGVNTAVLKVRQALNDTAGSPMYIETVPGKGYRFAAPVTVVETARAVGAPLRLAVLPFATLGVGSDGDYLGDGLTEETIASLGQLAPEPLRIIGRTSTMAYKKTDKSLAAIGRELRADYIVEGSVRRENERLRVTATLVRVHDEVQVWTSSYDRDGSNMIGVQQELSSAIARQVTQRLSPDRLTRFSRRQTSNADAYDLYLRGRRFWNQLTPATTRSAVEYFTRATELDPGYALAWAGIAEAFASSPINGDVAPDQAGARARSAIANAMRADPSLAEVQHVAGQVSFFLDWDWPAAEVAYRRATELDASFAFAHSMLAHVLSQTGRHEEARRVAIRARETDPLSALDHAMSSQIAFQAGDFVTALGDARQAIAIDPEFWVGHMMRSQAHEQLGDLDYAVESASMAARLSGGNSKPLSLRGYILARQGRVNESTDVLAMLEQASRHRYLPPYATALVQAGLNDDAAVFASLDRAFLARDVHLVFLTVDPKWDRLRDDARFRSLIARCNFLSRGNPQPE